VILVEREVQKQPAVVQTAPSTSRNEQAMTTAPSFQKRSYATLLLFAICALGAFAEDPPSQVVVSPEQEDPVIGFTFGNSRRWARLEPNGRI